MREIAERLRRVEDRLERLLASGWRTAAVEAVDLVEEADALTKLGLPALASRLREVGAASGEAEALPRIALSLTALRLIRARLAVDDPPPGSWLPIVDRAKRRPALSDRLVPLGRLLLGHREVWATARIRGAVLSEIVLLDPVPVAPSVEIRVSSNGESPVMIGGDDQETTTRMGNGAGISNDAVPWLRGQLQGHLRWQARFPLGANGEVQHCALTAPEWHLPKKQTDAFAPFRAALANGKLKDGQWALAASNLRAIELDPAETDRYVWPDTAASAAFPNSAPEPAWVLAWTPKDLIVPLAILIPGDASRDARLIHLVPGSPTVSLAR